MIALQMLRAGAGGTTATELDAVIGPQNTDAGAALIGQLDRFDGDPGGVDEDAPPTPPVFHQATGIFIDDSLDVKADYLEVLGSRFDSGVYPVDFADPETESALNNWLAVNTGGKISKTPTEYNPETVISLLSTVFLAAAWQQPFSPESTEAADFTAADGSVGEVNMMHKTVAAGWLSGPGWTGVQLPYSDGLAMQVFLPEPGRDVGTLLDGQVLSEAGTNLREAPQTSVSVSLPRWDVTGSVDLKTVLIKLGVRDLFTDAADLTGISPQLLVTAAAQDSTITVGEKGTVAASATQIDVGVTALPPEDQVEVFVADRPYVYQIIDTSTGLPLFLGSINRPGRV
jgi:serpin B